MQPLASVLKLPARMPIRAGGHLDTCLLRTTARPPTRASDTGSEAAIAFQLDVCGLALNYWPGSKRLVCAQAASVWIPPSRAKLRQKQDTGSRERSNSHQKIQLKYKKDWAWKRTWGQKEVLEQARMSAGCKGKLTGGQGQEEEGQGGEQSTHSFRQPCKFPLPSAP